MQTFDKFKKENTFSMMLLTTNGFLRICCPSCLSNRGPAVLVVDSFETFGIFIFKKKQFYKGNSITCFKKRFD
jgi:hypothetical protein